MGSGCTGGTRNTLGSGCTGRTRNTLGPSSTGRASNTLGSGCASNTLDTCSPGRAGRTNRPRLHNAQLGLMTRRHTLFAIQVHQRVARSINYEAIIRRRRIQPSHKTRGNIDRHKIRNCRRGNGAYNRTRTGLRVRSDDRLVPGSGRFRHLNRTRSGHLPYPQDQIHFGNARRVNARRQTGKVELYITAGCAADGQINRTAEVHRRESSIHVRIGRDRKRLAKQGLGRRGDEGERQKKQAAAGSGDLRHLFRY